MTISPSEFNMMTASAIVSKAKQDVKVVENYLIGLIRRLKFHDQKINAFNYFDQNEVEKQIFDIKNRDYQNLPLAFVPVAIKDNICTKGMPTTCSSRFLEGFIPPYDATVVKKLRQAGAILFGKLNCDEFAMGSSNETSYFGPVKNPWDTTKVPGGSSGGSAAAVAANMVPIALGSDTGGSIRQPASFCGVTGFKPTYGLVSRYGLVAFASSLDQIGPISRTVRDAALLLDVIVGKDLKDSTSKEPIETGYSNHIDSLSTNKDLKGKTVGVIEFEKTHIQKDVLNIFDSAIKQLTDLGAKIKPISLSNLKYAISTYYIIATAEASANLARFDGIRFGRASDSILSLADQYSKSRTEGFGDEVKRRIFLGTYVLSAGYRDDFYIKATRVREMVKQDFQTAFKSVDYLVTPTAPSTAFDIGSKRENPLEMYLSDIFTIGVNLAGLPAISIPSGFGDDGLPCGLQIIGNSFKDKELLEAAHIYEMATNWKDMRPSGFE